MRSNIFVLSAGLLFILITDLLLFLQIKNCLHRQKYRWVYWLHSLLFIAGLLFYHFRVPRLKGPDSYYWIELGIGIVLLFYVPKLFFILTDAFFHLAGLLSRKLRKAGRIAATVTALACFLLLLYSITWGRYNYKTDSVTVCFPQLPPAFDNFRIVQLSDLHLGSFSSRYKGIPKLIEEVNRLRPDVIIFTGDMVNNFAAELVPWIDALSRMKAVYGKFAVTGNHDYGDYTRWKRPEAKQQNRADFFRHMQEAGFHMLNNANQPLVKGADTLYIAGVENWGNPPFPRYGRLEDALRGTAGRFTILLSHDPSHWREEVLGYDIPLTLSGHTHAMQMGFKIGRFSWSPARYLYPEYDGLYENNKCYLYVSRGQGYLGFPGRIGLRPVITEITLTNDCDNRRKY